MVSTPTAEQKDSAQAATRRRSRKSNPPPQQRDREGHASGKYALAKGPLGIMLAGLLLVEAVIGIVARSSLPPGTASFFVFAMILLAFGVFAGFFYVLIRMPPGVLHPPSAFRDDQAWLAAVGHLRPMEPVLPAAPKEPAVGNNVAAASAPGMDAGAGTPLSPPPGAPLFDDHWMAGELQGGCVTSTLLMDLSRYLGEKSWGYLSVDTNHRWLLSRLFIFISLYRAIRQLSCIVFVQLEEGGEKLLGVADPAKVCSVIAKRHPHFNTTLADILTQQNVPISMAGAVDEYQAIFIMDDFVRRLQSTDDHASDPEWSMLSTGWWEHTVWLNPGMVNEDFAPALFDARAALFQPAPEMSQREIAFEIMRRDSRFVALVGEHGEFHGVYDKQRIFDEFKERALIAAS